MDQTISIAYLEDEPDQSNAVVKWLSKHSIVVQCFSSADAINTALESCAYDAIILDVELYGEQSGFEVLKEIRLARGLATPVLMVSSNDHWQDSLNLGADDFLEKPLSANTLLVRLKRLMRPVEQEAPIENYAPFQLNTAQNQMTLDGSHVDLSAGEYDLASTLFRNYGKVLSFRELMETLSDGDECKTREELMGRMVKLKRKMKLSNIDDWQLEAVYQHGYRMVSIRYDLDDETLVTQR